MNEFVFLLGTFFGIWLCWGIWIFDGKRRYDKKIQEEINHFKVQFITKMANADKYIVGPLALTHQSSLINSFVVSANVDTAITVKKSRGWQIINVDMQNYSCGIEILPVMPGMEDL